MTLDISLLGSPLVRRNGETLALPGHRPLALLAYLLTTSKPQRREHLVDLLFDRSNDPRAALRWTMSKLSNTLGAETVRADRETISFNFACDYRLDTKAFAAGDLTQYRGDFLAGLRLRDAMQFEEWLLVQREYWRALYQTELEKRLDAQIEARDATGITETAVKLLQTDNLREDWRRVLMSAYAQQGKFEAALAQFNLNHEILRQELAQEPAPETIALAQKIRAEQAEVYRTLSSRTSSKLPAARPSWPPPAAEQEEPGPTPEETTAPPAPARRTLKRLALLAGGVVLLLFVAAAAYWLLNSRGLVPVGSGAGASSGDQPAPGELAGTTVTIGGGFDPNSDRELLPYREGFRPFEEETGIKIEYISYGDDYLYVADDVVLTGLAPDIIIFSQPGYLADLVEQGRVIDVRSFMDEAFLRQHYSEAMLEAAMVKGQMAGVWHTTNIKSLVWYAKPAFDVAGYSEPQTWEQLMKLTEQIAADGETPWCIGMEMGETTGWVGTDWVENILLRTAPPETYDAWVAGDLPFDSPEIRRVFAILAAIWLEDTYVYGGAQAIAQGDVIDSLLGLFAEPPRCLLHSQASFALSFIPDEAQFGRDYDFFYLPPIDEEFGRPVLGAGDMVVMFHDRPEVRELMHYIASGKSAKPFVESGGAIAPQRDAPFEWYSSPATLKMAQILLEADTYRFDGSDLMPAEVGVRAFWQGMVDWVEGEDLDTVLRAIDDAWPK